MYLRLIVAEGAVLLLAHVCLLQQYLGNRAYGERGAADNCGSSESRPRPPGYPVRAQGSNHTRPGLPTRRCKAQPDGEAEPSTEGIPYGVAR